MFGMGMFSSVRYQSHILRFRLIPRPRNAGFFIWIDLSPYLSSKECNDDGWKAEYTLKQLITNVGIPIASGAGYRAERPGWFRVLFTVDRDSLEEALRRYSPSLFFILTENTRLTWNRIINVAKAGN